MKVIYDPNIKAAIRLLRAKGVTIEQIEEVYKYYDRLKNLVKNIEDVVVDS